VDPASFIDKNLALSYLQCKTLLAMQSGRANLPLPLIRYVTMFKTIALITNNRAAEISDTLQAVVKYLQMRDVEIILDELCAALMPDTALRRGHAGEFAKDCDLAIAIGGDGTMLRAAHLLADHDIPLLGINRGRLGFLADIPANSVSQHLDAILAGDYIEDERFQLHCEIESKGEILLESHAFNDVIIQKGNVAKLIELETYVNENFLHSQRADGMIVSSPTGSTAYALSGGGPILHPALNALVLVPICPHTLSNRPIVIDGNSVVEIVVGTPHIDQGKLTCDGEIICELATEDKVTIQKKNKKIRLIHPADHDHFKILRGKLDWG